jgi:hypothetical protein
MTSKCCKNSDHSVHTTTLTLEQHKFNVVINYCKSCGIVLSRSHIKESKQ